MGGFFLLSSIGLKTSVLLLFVTAASGLLKRSSAAVRHWIWACALAMCLAMPITILWVPSLSILPSSWAPSGPEGVPPAGARPPAHTSFLLKPLNNPGESAGLSGAWPAIFTVWWVGTIGLLLRDALAHAGLVRWLRRARPLRSGGWIATLQSLPIRRRSRLLILECPSDNGPCTWGFVRPVLMLPAGGDGWPESRRRHALLHEQAHLDRHDALTALIARMACAMHWFNPLVWFAAAQLRVLQEKACDDAVLRAGVRPSDYAQFLLDLASRNRNAAMFPTILGMIGCSPLQTRIRSILDCNRSRTERGLIASLAGLCLLGGLSVTLAAIAFATPTKSDSSAGSLITANAMIQPHAITSVSVSANPIPSDAFGSSPLRGRLVVPVELRFSNHKAPDERPRSKTHTPRVIPPMRPVPSTPAIPALAAVPPAPPRTKPLPPLSVVLAIPAAAVVPALPAIPAIPPTAALEPALKNGCKRINFDTDESPGAAPRKLALTPRNFV